MVNGRLRHLSGLSAAVLTETLCVTLLAFSPASARFGQAPALSQSHKPSDRSLVLKQSIRPAWEGPASYGIFGTARCDAQGKLYLRPVTPVQESAAAAPVVEIPASGAVGPTFSPASIPGFNDQTDPIGSFAPNADGGVQFVYRKCKANWPGCGVQVAKFRPDGAFQSVSKLAGPDFRPEQVAVFPDGRLFVTGFTTAGTSTVQYAAVYASDGTLVARVSLPADARVPGQPMGHVGQGAGIAFVASGPGSTILLVRPVFKAMLYAVDEAGKVVSHAPVTAPFPNGVPVGVRYVGDSHALLQFATRNPRGQVTSEGYFFAVVDVATGKSLGNYRADARSGGVLGCYLPKKGLEFLTSTGGSGGRGPIIRFDSLP